MDKAYEICIEIFEQRNYEIVEKDDERILAIKPDGNQVCAFFTRTRTKFNVDTVQECISMMNKMDINHAIIIYKDIATPVAKKIVDEIVDMIIELFNEEELQYNITKHYLVPKHELLHSKDSSESKHFKKNKYPLILKTDPVCKFYGFKIGDVTKVTRKNNNIMYRIVRQFFCLLL